jgi:hypothetical protein
VRLIFIVVRRFNEALGPLTQSQAYLSVDYRVMVQQWSEIPLPPKKWKTAHSRSRGNNVITSLVAQGLVLAIDSTIRLKEASTKHC